MHSITKSLSLLFILAAGLSSCDSPSPKGEPGLAMGLYAVVSNSGGEILSNEFEVELVEDGIADSNFSPPNPPATNNARIVGRDLVSRPPSQHSYEELVASVALPSVLDAECERKPDTLPTFSGKICWTAVTNSAQVFAQERTLTNIVYMTPDGMYHAMIDGRASTVSSDLLSSGVSLGVGCAASPDGETVDVDYLESLLGISMSTTFGFYMAGISTFFTERSGLERAFQYDSGISVGVSLFPFISFALSMQYESGFLISPTRIDGTCSAQVVANDSNVFAGKDGNAYEIIAEGLQEMRDAPATSYRDVMLSETAAAALPTFQLLASTTGTAPEDGIPAANHADLSADFFARSGAELCSDCPDTSLDSFLYRFREDAGDSAGDGEATREATLGAFGQYLASTPDTVRFSVTQRRGDSALRFAYLAHADLAAELRGDRNRYVSADIVDVDARVGVPVAIQISSQEIANLLGVDPSTLEGAQVTIDGSPRIEAATFELRDGSIDVEVTTANTDPLLLVVDVDLTTAVGPFSETPNADWAVRPAMRRIQAKSGPAAAILLSAPIRSKAGYATVLTAFVTDENYAPVDEELSVRFYDGENNLLGETPIADGTAQISTTLIAGTPTIEAVTATTLSRGEQRLPGFAIAGTGFSRRAKLLVNDRMLEQGEWAILSSKEIVFSDEVTALPAGQHKLTIENPDGHSATHGFLIE